MTVTPEIAWAELAAGNERFATGTATHPHADAARLAEVRPEVTLAGRELSPRSPREAIANGIVSALTELGDAATRPLVVRLDGNNVEEGRAILNEAAHPLVIQAATMDEGADKAAELANA